VKAGVFLSTFVVATAIASSALALSQSKHRSLSWNACIAHHLDSDFCDEVGAAAYNVDHYEWDLMAAHAQPEVDEAKCDAANKAVVRIRDLALEMRATTTSKSWDSTDLAKALGRALHTIQDNCAHSGVPNAEHAWFSLSDSCLDTQSSPDIQPEAVACAEQETTLAFDSFVKAVAAQIVTVHMRNDPDQQRQVPMYFPPRSGVCEYLKSSTTWNGVDSRWNNDLVVPALQDQLLQTLVVNPESPTTDVCAAGESAIEPLSSVPNVDTSQPIEWCTHLNIYCVGKTDSADTAPPWESSDAPPAGSSGATGDDSGCSVGHAPSGGAGLSLLVLSALALRRRRARR
jgi:MYXO-CTERM domain-containing protein